MELDRIEYFDITPAISASMAVFPGDTPFSRKVELDFKKGDHLVLSSVQTSLHLGAHTDGPNHYHPQGKSIAQRPLHYYMGACQVVEVNLPRGQRIHSKDIAGVEISAPRVLFKTGSFPNPDKWNDDFNSLSRDLIEKLADLGVVLVGIDTPSIDPGDDKILESHRAVYSKDMAILEGIVLTKVKPGTYDLIALPLPIEDGDASPVRAILIKENSLGSN